AVGRDRVGQLLDLSQVEQQQVLRAGADLVRRQLPGEAVADGVEDHPARTVVGAQLAVVEQQHACPAQIGYARGRTQAGVRRGRPRVEDVGLHWSPIRLVMAVVGPKLGRETLWVPGPPHTNTMMSSARSQIGHRAKSHQGGRRDRSMALTAAGASRRSQRARSNRYALTSCLDSPARAMVAACSGQSARAGSPPYEMLLVPTTAIAAAMTSSTSHGSSATNSTMLWNWAVPITVTVESARS